jgi:heme/copper-type cytochrome/quinol oxidase subunit 2
MGEKCAADTPTSQQAAGDKETQHPAFSTSALFAFLVFVFVPVLVLVFFVVLASLTQKMSKHHTAHPATAQHPAANQQAKDPAIVITLAGSFITVAIVVFAFVPVLATFAHQMRSEQPANATTPQQTAGDQQLEDAMLLVTAFAIVGALIVVFVFPFLAMFAQQMRDKQAANATAPQQTAGNQQLEDAVLLITLLAVAKVLVRLFTATFAQQTRKQQSPHAPPSHRSSPHHHAAKIAFTHSFLHSGFRFFAVWPRT